MKHPELVCTAAVLDEAELNAPYVPPVGPEMAVPGLRLYTRGENLAEQASMAYSDISPALLQNHACYPCLYGNH